jgi:hypothetical protein
MQRQELSVQDAKLEPLPIPAKYRFLPKDVRSDSPYNVAQLYMELGESIQKDAPASPGFDAAVRRQLVGLDGMSYKEVANLLNVPVGTVRSRLSRGRHQLRLLTGMEEQAFRKTSVKSETADRCHNSTAKYRRAA